MSHTPHDLLTDQGSMPVKNPWQKLTTMGSSSSRQDTVDEPKATLFQTAQTLKRLSSNLRKTPPPKLPQQRADSIEQPAPAAQQQSSPTSLLRKTTQDLLRKKSFVEPNQPPSNDRSNSSSRRISMVVNDEQNPPPTKIAAPHPFERSPSMQSRTLTRSNSINPANKDQDKSSSGERSQHTSAAQSRRVSMGLNRSPVRAEDLEKLLAKVIVVASFFAASTIPFPVAGRERRGRSIGKFPKNIRQKSNIAPREIPILVGREETRTGRSEAASRCHSLASEHIEQGEKIIRIIGECSR